MQDGGIVKVRIMQDIKQPDKPAFYSKYIIVKSHRFSVEKRWDFEFNWLNQIPASISSILTGRPVSIDLLQARVNARDFSASR